MYLCHRRLEIEVAELNDGERVVPLQVAVVVVLPRSLVILAGGAEVQRLGEHPSAASPDLRRRFGREGDNFEKLRGRNVRAFLSREGEVTRLQSHVPGRAGVVQKDVRVVAVLVERPAAADADLAVSAEGVGMAESHSAVRHELQVAAALHLWNAERRVADIGTVIVGWLVGWYIT